MIYNTYICIYKKKLCLQIKCDEKINPKCKTPQQSTVLQSTQVHVSEIVNNRWNNNFTRKVE